MCIKVIQVNSERTLRFGLARERKRIENGTIKIRTFFRPRNKHKAWVNTVRTTWSYILGE